jgi:phasin family protein
VRQIREAAVTDEKNVAPGSIDETAEQTIDLARGAMESYLDFFQRTMFASPWAQTDLNKKIQGYAGKNVATTFEFAQKLTRAKDLQEVVQIQTEFMQTQLKALGEQAKELGETATKAASDALKRPKT